MRRTTQVMHRLRDQRGFTVLESMVAMVVLLIGLGAGLQLLDAASGIATSSRAREQGTALARELVETARSIPYERLAATGTAALVQAADDDLRDAAAGTPGWNVRRRGVTYTVAVGACAIDHPVDGIGTHDAATFCATGAGTTTASRCRELLGASGSIAGAPGAAGAGAQAGDCGVDANFDGTVDGLTAGCAVSCSPTSPADATPADTKRVVVLVRWDRGGGSRYVLQSASVPFRGNGNAPVVTGPVGPTSITGGSSAAYTAGTDRAATAMEWVADGVPVPGGSGSGTSWALTWALGTPGAPGAAGPAPGEVLDGVHTLAARALDADASAGQQRALTVTVNRRRPYPLRVSAGRDSTGVVVEWQASLEGDVSGYRVFRRIVADGPVEVVCASTTTTKCRDLAPPAADTSYWAVALDKDAAGAERTGDEPASKPVVRVTNTPPAPPADVRVVRTGSGAQLTWTASAGDPDPGDAVAFYRIYRDGRTSADRLDRTMDGQVTSYLDGATGTRVRTYYVSAVDGQLGESALVRAG